MRDVEDLNRTGVELQNQGDLSGARLHYLAALRGSPDSWENLANMVRVEGELGRLESALGYALRAQAIFSDSRLNNDIGNLLMRLNRHAEAEVSLVRARTLMPEDPITWQNSALLSYRRGEIELALSYMDEALALSPNSIEIRANRAYILLALGRNLTAAFEEFEYRWYDQIHLNPWDLHIPEWQGQDLDGKRILFHSEQGFGDAIMMARFSQDLASRDAQVIMALPPALVRLFDAQSWPHVYCEATDKIEDGAMFDYHTPMFSTLRWLGYEREDISPAPYIKPDFRKFAHQRDGSFKVGLCWASGKWNMDSALRRTIPLELFLSLVAVPGVSLYSLQKGSESTDIETLGIEGLITDVTSKLGDWYDTAALIAQLDLVIAVDTAVAHLAGAIGKPVIMLSPYTRCWRWWDAENGTGLPWYDTMTLIPQTQPGTWNKAVSTVIQLVKTLASKERLRNAPIAA